MNLEKTDGLRKFSMNLFNHTEQKVLSKLNFFRFIGRFQNNAKKIFLTPLGLVHQYNSPKP